jgi:hypothetical protein
VVSKSRQNPRQPSGQGCDAKTNPQQSGFPVHSQTRHLLCNLGFSQQAPRTISKDLPCGREGYPAISAYQQRTSYFGFQSLHLFRECWLTDMKCFGRLTEVEAVGEHQEGTQLR